MKPKKLIRYRLPVSVKFPATHPRKGEPTLFVDKIKANGLSYIGELDPKLHTLRGNYALWAKRFEKIERGEAVLEPYTWEGKPYASKAVTVCQLGKDDGVGIQKLTFDFDQLKFPRAHNGDSSCVVLVDDLAKNDGLTIKDFLAWFKGYDITGEMCIIHFTPFRY